MKTIIAVFFLFLVAFFIIVATDSYKKQRYAHEHFKPVQGVIVRSQIKCSGTHRDCTPFVEYAYQYGAIDYTATRYAFISDDEPPSRRVARYPVHTKVTVYIDPDNPSLSVLDTTPQSVLQVAVMAGLPFLVGLGVWLAGREAMRRLAGRRPT